MSAPNVAPWPLARLFISQATDSRAAFSYPESLDQLMLAPNMAPWPLARLFISQATDSRAAFSDPESLDQLMLAPNMASWRGSLLAKLLTVEFLSQLSTTNKSQQFIPSLAFHSYNTN